MHANRQTHINGERWRWETNQVNDTNYKHEKNELKINQWKKMKWNQQMMGWMNESFKFECNIDILKTSKEIKRANVECRINWPESILFFPAQ